MPITLKFADAVRGDGTTATSSQQTWQRGAALGARFFRGIRCADGRDILNSTIGAGPSRTEQNVSYSGRGVLVHFSKQPAF